MRVLACVPTCLWPCCSFVPYPQLKCFFRVFLSTPLGLDAFQTKMAIYNDAFAFYFTLLWFWFSLSSGIPDCFWNFACWFLQSRLSCYIWCNYALLWFSFAKLPWPLQTCRFRILFIYRFCVSIWFRRFCLANWLVWISNAALCFDTPVWLNYLNKLAKDWILDILMR
jgi:hypothetical protein